MTTGLRDALEAEIGELDHEEMHADFAEAMAFEAQKDARKLVIDLLRQLRSIEAGQREDDRWFTRMMADYSEKKQRRGRAIAFLTEQIQRHAAPLLPPKSKHVDVLGLARIQFTTHQPTVEVADAGALIAWAKAHEHPELVRVKEEPKVAEVKALVAETGELPPGVERVPEHTTSAITWEDPRND